MAQLTWDQFNEHAGQYRIIVHCSASHYGTASLINAWHLKRGWGNVAKSIPAIGYQGVVENGFPTYDHWKKRVRVRMFNGQWATGRPMDADDDIEAHEIGAHAYGFNRTTIAIALVGLDTFTSKQIVTLVKAIKLFQHWFKIPTDKASTSRLLLGHNELPGVTKACPNLDMDTLRALVLNKNEGFHLLRKFPNVQEVY